MNPKLIFAINKLDFISSGLTLLTNSPVIYSALKENDLEKSYRVRVYGKSLDEEKLNKLRKGVVVGGKILGPNKITIVNKMTSNTVLNILTKSQEQHQIKKIMERESLRVNRLEMQKIGPYYVSMVPFRNDMLEVEITSQVRSLIDGFLIERLNECHRSMKTKALSYIEKCVPN